MEYARVGAPEYYLWKFFSEVTDPFLLPFVFFYRIFLGTFRMLLLPLWDFERASKGNRESWSFGYPRFNKVDGQTLVFGHASGLFKAKVRPLLVRFALRLLQPEFGYTGWHGTVEFPDFIVETAPVVGVTSTMFDDDQDEFLILFGPAL